MVVVERAGLTDPTVCPSCGASLLGPRCVRCGVDLANETGERIWTLSGQIAALMGEREDLIRALRAEARARRAAPAQQVSPQHVPAHVPGPPAGAAPPYPPPQLPPGGPQLPPGPPRPAGNGIGVHGLLVGLGALLLSVAAIGFLIFSWAVLPLAGRAAVIAGLTVGVLALATWLRPRLPETGEAVGALGVVLVLGDAWAVRGTGLLGADRPEPLGYAAAAVAVCAVLLGGWGALGRVRAGTIAASVLAPLALVLTGVRISEGVESAAPTALGLVAAALLATGRRALPAAWDAERMLLRLAAGLGVLLGAGLAAPSVGNAPATGAVLVLAAAAVAAVQAVADRDRRDLGRVWCFAAGLLAAGVALPVTIGVADAGGDTWNFVTLPAVAGAVLLALAALAGPRPATRAGFRPVAAAAGAAGVAVLLAVPAAIGAVVIASRAAVLSLDTWRTAPTAAIGRAGDRFGDVPGDAWLSVLCGLLVLAGATLAATVAGRGATRLTPALRVAGAGAAGLALLVAPLAPGLMVAVSVVLLPAVAAALAVAAHRLTAPAAPALYGAAALAGSLGVVVAWSTRELSVPATVAGILALLLARRPAGDAVARALLTAAAAAAGLVVAGAVAALLDAGPAERLTTAGIAGAALAALALAGPAVRRAGPELAARERLAAAGVALVGVLVALPATYAGTDPTRGVPLGQQLLPAALLAAALAVAALARPAVTERLDVRPFAALVVTPLAAALVAAVVRDLADVPAEILLAATVAVAGIGAGVLGLLRPGTPAAIRVALESGAAAVGAYALVFAVLGRAAANGVPERLWIVLLLVGTGAAGVAAAPDRRRAGWLAGLLLAGSTWARLALWDVGVVEAYTLPPAAALLAVAALRLRRDPAADPLRVLAPGATLALLPSILAVTRPSPLRPALLLAVAVAILAAAALLRTGDAGSRAARLRPALALLAGGTALGTALVRVAHEFARGGLTGYSFGDVEYWSLPAAAILAGAAWLLHRDAAEDSPAAALALGVAAVPSLLATFAGGDLTDGPIDALRPILAFLLAATLLAASVRRDEPRPFTPPQLTALAVAVLATVAGLSTGRGPAPEVWWLPLAALLLAVGAHRMADGATGSWPALGPGVATALLPSLVLAVEEPPVTLRSVLLIALAAAAVFLGAARKLQAPLLLGAGVLAVHAVRHLSPYVADLYAQVPLWGTLATAGVLLLVVGATYERRVRQLREARLRLAALR